MNILDALDVTIENPYGDDYTLRSYFKELLLKVWEEEDSFSGKRPFGDSSWQCDVAKALVQAGFVQGGLDEDGYLDDYNQTEFMNLIRGLVVYIFDGA